MIVIFCEIIHISFSLRTVLQEKYYSLEGENERYMIQTRSQMKASGVQLPEVHGSRKGLDPHKILEKTATANSKVGYRNEA